MQRCIAKQPNGSLINPLLLHERVHGFFSDSLTIYKLFTVQNKWIYRYFVWGKLYAKNIVEGHDFDESVFFGEDILFNIKVLSQAGIKITYTNERLYYYYIRPGSAVSENLHRKRTGLCKICLKYADLEKDKRIKKIYLTFVIKRSLYTRYDVSIQEEYKYIAKECNLCIKRALKYSNLWQGTERLAYFILNNSPIIR